MIGYVDIDGDGCWDVWLIDIDGDGIVDGVSSF